MQTYQVEYDAQDLKGAIKCGFSYMETKDEIVGTIYVAPNMAKNLVLSAPDEIHFDYIPEGIGMLRTAYLKYLPSVKDNEIRFVNQEDTLELRLYLK